MKHLIIGNGIAGVSAAKAIRELDGEAESDINKEIRALLSGNRSVEIDTRLEDACGHPGHFGKCYDVKKFFGTSKNIAEPFRKKVRELLVVV